MREIVYYHGTEDGSDLLVRKVRDPDEGIYTGYIWNPGKQEWVEGWEETYGFFTGEWRAAELTEDELKKHMKRQRAEYLNENK